MANSRDFTGKNRKFTGTKGIVMPKGSTAERADTESGEMRFNTTTELMEYYDGNQWKPIDAPPTISAISTSDVLGDDVDLAADGSTLFTVTITGGNFSIGANVKFIGNTGTEYSAGNVNRVSGSSITCTTVSNMGLADDPYDVQVINTSGLAALLEDALTFNAPPAFVTAAGSLGTVFNGVAASLSSSAATDAEGDTITYSIVSGSLPGSGLSLSSSTGLITGTLSGTPSLGVYPFTVRAATAEGSTDRQFSVTVAALPSGGTITTSGGYRYHQFLSGGNFVVSSGSFVTNAILAGGGGGGGQYGGGGGGGAVVYVENVTLTAATYPVVIGGGGPKTGVETLSSTRLGTSSTFNGYTANGGGGGGCYNNKTSSAGANGGGAGAYGSINGNSGSTGSVTSQAFATVYGGNTGGNQTDAEAGSYPLSGGAGAGGNGFVPPNGNGSSPGGNGGVGIQINSFDSNNYYWAGGGGGGIYNTGNGGAGGIGGGGAGNGSVSGGGSALNSGGNSVSQQIGGNGGTNTGGGGGGGGYDGGNGTSPGSGGSGIVIVRYAI